VFTLSALLGWLGGGLFAGGFTYISPDRFGFAESVVFLTMALLGGARSPLGAAFGTALLILLPEWLRFLKVTCLAVYGGAVILIMVFMPDGIWGFLERSGSGYGHLQCCLSVRLRRCRPPRRWRGKTIRPSLK
jgi:branched-chain amino acid transport system permease protein